MALSCLCAPLCAQAQSTLEEQVVVRTLGPMSGNVQQYSKRMSKLEDRQIYEAYASELNGEDAKALKLCRKLTKDYPDDLYVKVMLANELNHTEQYEEAEPLYRAAISSDGWKSLPVVTRRWCLVFFDHQLRTERKLNEAANLERRWSELTSRN